MCHILCYSMQKVCSAAQKGLVQLGSYLCCNWLSLYMQLDGLAQVKREIRSASPPKDNINMQRISCVMECRISVQMGKVPVCGRSQSLRVHQVFGDVEGSGSTINLGDRGGEKCEMIERSWWSARVALRH